MKGESELRKRCDINSNAEGDRFVGVKSDGDALNICFPLGYCLPSDDRLLRQDILNLITVLSKFSGIKDRRLPAQKMFAQSTVDFPIQAYMSIMNNYMNLGYYTEKEIKYTESRRGKIDWSRTIKNQTPVPQSGSFVYLDYIVKESISNSENLITLIHEYCVFESYQKIGWLFTRATPNKPRIAFEEKLFLGTVYKKLSQTFDDKNKELFNSIISMIKYLGDKGISQQFYFGTDRFEYVWQNLIDFTFGIDNKERYFPRTTWNLNSGSDKVNAALEPDTIMVVGDKVFVLDAKYYRYGATRVPAHLPESSSINKQITYGEYVAMRQEFKQEFGPNLKVYNAFLMPFGKNAEVFKHVDNYRHIGEAVSSWKNGIQEHERVQGILIDIRYLMHNYVKHSHPDIIKLADMIEQATTITYSNP